MAGRPASATFATTLGGAQLYDSQCNSLATAAGINDVTGNAFVAWMSDATSNARARLGASARGWVRMDGRPFADTQSDLFSNNVVFHPIRLDENGTDPGRQLVLTGANTDVYGIVTAGSNRTMLGGVVAAVATPANGFG